MDYEKQIALKEEALRAILPSTTVLLPSTISETKGFRNKAKIIVSGTLEDPVLGLLDREILDCPVHNPEINRLIKEVIPFIQTARLNPYNLQSRRGELKGLIIFHGDETYLRIVLRSKEPLDRIRKHLPEFLLRNPNISSVTVNIQPIHQAILEGEEEIFLGPKDYVTQKFGSFRLHLRPQGFVQTNQRVAAQLYATAAEWVKELKIRNFLELFSGQGAFSFHCSASVEKATGIEINSSAVESANETAKELGLNHLEFLSQDASDSEEFIRKRKPDLILVNPPRRGLGESLKLFTGIKPEWIIYSSCSIESLEKDLKELSKLYQVERAQLFDMFPHTAHFETLVLLRLQR